MRFGALKLEDYRMMRDAGFRFLLFGLESASQLTLDRINKGIKVQDIVDGCKWAKQAGLNPHLTVMMGYPWEDYAMAKKTIDFAKHLFIKGFADTLQATIVVPYPNTRLYGECLQQHMLAALPGEWEKFDMRQLAMRSPLSELEIKELTSSLYRLYFTPQYTINQLLSVRSWSDISYMFRGVGKVVGKHLKDFRK
jgi:radical SAM superfamily enzyme YgiQ (UPF0313 family)